MFISDITDTAAIAAKAKAVSQEYAGAIEQNQKRRVRALIRNIDHPEQILVMYCKNNDGRSTKVVLPGGGVEMDETVYQALAREMREELGVTAEVNSKTCKYFTSFKNYRGTKGGAPTDKAIAEKNYVELIFMELYEFDHVPINMEAYRGVIGFEWITPKALLAKLADKEETYVGQTHLQTVLMQLRHGDSYTDEVGSVKLYREERGHPAKANVTVAPIRSKLSY